MAENSETNGLDQSNGLEENLETHDLEEWSLINLKKQEEKEKKENNEIQNEEQEQEKSPQQESNDEGESNGYFSSVFKLFSASSVSLPSQPPSSPPQPSSSPQHPSSPPQPPSSPPQSPPSPSSLHQHPPLVQPEPRHSIPFQYARKEEFRNEKQTQDEGHLEMCTNETSHSVVDLLETKVENQREKELLNQWVVVVDEEMELNSYLQWQEPVDEEDSSDLEGVCVSKDIMPEDSAAAPSIWTSLLFWGTPTARTPSPCPPFPLSSPPPSSMITESDPNLESYPVPSESIPTPSRTPTPPPISGSPPLSQSPPPDLQQPSSSYFGVLNSYIFGGPSDLEIQPDKEKEEEQEDKDQEDKEQEDKEQEDKEQEDKKQEDKEQEDKEQENKEQEDKEDNKKQDTEQDKEQEDKEQENKEQEDKEDNKEQDAEQDTERDKKQGKEQQDQDKQMELLMLKFKVFEETFNQFVSSGQAVSLGQGFPPSAQSGSLEQVATSGPRLLPSSSPAPQPPPSSSAPPLPSSSSTLAPPHHPTGLPQKKTPPPPPPPPGNTLLPKAQSKWKRHAKPRKELLNILRELISVSDIRLDNQAKCLAKWIEIFSDTPELNYKLTIIVDNYGVLLRKLVATPFAFLKRVKTWEMGLFSVAKLSSGEMKDLRKKKHDKILSLEGEQEIKKDIQLELAEIIKERKKKERMREEAEAKAQHEESLRKKLEALRMVQMDDEEVDQHLEIEEIDIEQCKDAAEEWKME